MSIHSTAIVGPDAVVHSSADVGPYVVIDGHVSIGPGCQISASAVILGNTTLGTNTRVHSHAVIGDVPQDRAYHGELSFCHIGESCIIREGATIHRATGEGLATRIGDRCHLMTNSHVAHNCDLGNDVTLVSGALLGGHVQVGDKAVISGNVGIHQFVRIGELAMIGGVTIIVQDVPPFLMTGRDGSVVGLNSVGLQRAGFDAGERHEIKDLFRLVYRSDQSREEILKAADQLALTDAGRRFVEFISRGSLRGIRRGSRQKTQV